MPRKDDNWYDSFGDREMMTADLQAVIDQHVAGFETAADNGYVPDPNQVDFIVLCKRCLKAETELGRLGSVVAGLTRKTENAAKTVAEKISDTWTWIRS